MDCFLVVGVERRRIYDIVNVLESVGVRTSNFLRDLFENWSALNSISELTLWFSILLLIDSYEEGQKSIYLERVWGDPQGFRGPKSMNCFLNFRCVIDSIRVFLCY